MTEVKIIEGNKLIAEFMGGELYFHEVNKDWRYRNLRDSSIGYTTYGLQYHFSWDWLMPVVEKIEALATNVTILNKYCRIIRFKGDYSGDIEYSKTETMASTKIENTYNAVIQFIQWHNEQQKPNN